MSRGIVAAWPSAPAARPRRSTSRDAAARSSGCRPGRLRCRACPCRTASRRSPSSSADPARGLLYGNRGCMHDADGRIRRRYGTRRWIACRLEFRGWHRGPKLRPAASPSSSSSTRRRRSQPGTVRARSAGAPTTCGWARSGAPCIPGQIGADAIDLQLHGERICDATRSQRHHEEPVDDLPDGTSWCAKASPGSSSARDLLRWTPSGYGDAQPRPRREHVRVITPRSLVAVLRARVGSDRALRPSDGVSTCVRPGPSRCPGRTPRLARLRDR